MDEAATERNAPAERVFASSSLAFMVKKREAQKYEKK